VTAEGVPAYVEIGDSVIYQNLQGEVVILNMARQEYYGLNDVGAAMWKMLLDQCDVEAVADRLTAEYEAEPETVRSDLSSLVQQLLSAGLLKKAQNRPEKSITLVI
jgi:hypothetical protein